MQKYQIIEKIATGSFGGVVKAKANESLYAIKTFHDLHTKGDGVPAVIAREILLSAKLKHPNIMSSEEVLLSDDHKVHMVMPYCEHSLASFLRTNISFDVIDFAFQLISGVHYLHENLILHRDIKPDNILIQDNETLKITDFGYAIFLTGVGANSPNMFSRHFRPPEALLNETNYDFSADMWCVGATLFEMITKTPLLKNSKTNNEQLLEIFDFYSTVNDLLPKELNPELRDLLFRLLVLSPKRRLTTKECLQHSVFQGRVQTSLKEYPFRMAVAIASSTRLSEPNQYLIDEWMKRFQEGEHLRTQALVSTTWPQVLNSFEITRDNAQLWAISFIWVCTKLCQDTSFSSSYASRCTGYTSSAENIIQCELTLLGLHKIMD